MLDSNLRPPIRQLMDFLYSHGEIEVDESQVRAAFKRREGCVCVCGGGGRCGAGAKEEMEMLNTRRVNRSQGGTAARASEGGGRGLRGAEGGGKKRLFNCDEMPASLSGVNVENNILLVVCLRGENNRLITEGLHSY